MSETVDIGATIISLMRGVIYREDDEDIWLNLHEKRGAIMDHFATIGVEVVVDDAEGYAYLRAHEPAEGETVLPRLVRRRPLSRNLSLLLVLLRKRLMEFETTDEGRLVLSTEEIQQLYSVFFPNTSNEAKEADRVKRLIRDAAELRFLKQLSSNPNSWEVRRIIKAYVDAETMQDFAARLEEYAQTYQEASPASDSIESAGTEEENE
ncbi:DUF4194 domain-containing protein [Mobiluncus porci]|uniref:DUF4194 domain-containing protein n=1 Tax=Mobiluncus porci TaxID=2652278 RepID=A0A7K0K4V0_9ACTO|nr:DUF4194 domain-containing protein [Mobiluncus porci]MST50474.1 DUF4194 domain-containing protein [Mobiluncus porci]